MSMESFDALLCLSAEDNEKAVMEIAAQGMGRDIALGVLLCANKRHGYWSQNAHESFKDFVEQLGVGSYSRMTRLADIGGLVVDGRITAGDVAEIGVAKMGVLLPLLKRGEVSAETIELAKVCPVRDLLVHLGRSVDRPQVTVVCPRCGHEFYTKEGK